MEGGPNKQYGLILPKKSQLAAAPALVKKPSVFADSDSEDEAPGDWMQKTLQKETFGGGYRTKHSKAEIEKILKEDSTVYEYDEVYDDIQKKRHEVTAAKETEKIERKPRYIQHLMAAADKRKKENERRINRQVQKEREAEGDEFADKEVFVTAAYKKKLEEMKTAEEEEKRQEVLETIGDVTKQGDLSGFYRHLYEKVVLDVDEVTEVANSNQQKSKKREKQAKFRQYRKRKSSESEEEPDDAKRRVEEANDPNVNIDDVEADPHNSSEPTASEPGIPDADADADLHSDSESEMSVKKEPEEEKEEEEPPKPNISIWEKRTIGEVFETALRRYYERKAARLAAVG